MPLFGLTPIDWETYLAHLNTEMDRSSIVSAENELDSIMTAQKETDETDDMAPLDTDFVNELALDEERAAVDGQSTPDQDAEDAFILDNVLRDLAAGQSLVINPSPFS